jgi:hypothetical protein
MMNKPDVGVLVAEYRQGHTLEAIASRHGLAPGTVRNHLLAAGEQLRPPGRRPGAAAPVGSGRDARARGNRPPPTIVGMAIRRIVDEGDVLTQRILEGLPSPVDDETLRLVRAKCLAAVVSVAAADLVETVLGRPAPTAQLPEVRARVLAEIINGKAPELARFFQ